MAADIRTLDDDADAALVALEAAARELEHWRAHLYRVKALPELGVAMQARRSSRVVAGVIADAVARTMDVTYRIEQAETQLRSVS